MTDRELMQMALDALQESKPIDINDPSAFYRSAHAIEALRARLAQPEPEELGEVVPADEDQLKRIAKLVAPEPVAWMHPTSRDCISTYPHSYKDAVPLYTAPPQRDDAPAKAVEWQGLTENEIKHLWYEACQTNLELTSQLIVHLARNIEAKLKEKNGG